jgi:hypothetical protein
LIKPARFLVASYRNAAFIFQAEESRADVWSVVGMTIEVLREERFEEEMK